MTDRELLNRRAARIGCVERPGRTREMSAKEMKPCGFAWESLDRLNPDRVHYSVLRLSGGEGGMDALRAMFPNAVATEMNFVLFSTSGIHGSYELIEDAEKVLREGSQDEAPPSITFLIVHPRIVGLRYGVCEPRSMGDIEFLKSLRESSKRAIARSVDRHLIRTARPPRHRIGRAMG